MDKERKRNHPPDSSGRNQRPRVETKKDESDRDRDRNRDLQKSEKTVEEISAEIQHERYQMDPADPNAQRESAQVQSAGDDRQIRRRLKSVLVTNEAFDCCLHDDDDEQVENTDVDFGQRPSASRRSHSKRRAFEPGNSYEGGPGAKTQPYFDHQLTSIPSTSNSLPADGGFRSAYWRARLKNSLRKAEGKSASSKGMKQQADLAEMESLVRDLNIYLTSHRQDKSVLPRKPKGIKTKFPRLFNKRVFANHFVITYRPTFYFLYTVYWKDTTYEHRHFSKLLKKALWKKLISGEHNIQKLEIEVVHLVYEGGSLLVSPKKFNWEGDTMDFDFRTMDSSREERGNQPAQSSFQHVEAIIKFEKAIETTELNAFLESTTQDDPQEFPEKFIQIGNLIMKKYCREDIHDHGAYFESGHFFFISQGANIIEKDIDLTALLEGRTGYFQSVRLLQAGLTLNVDIMTAPFYKVMKLSDAWRLMINMGSLIPQEKRDLFRSFSSQDTPFDQRMVDVVNEYWRKMAITTSHRQAKSKYEPLQLYSICRVTAEKAGTKLVTDFETNTSTVLPELMTKKYYGLPPVDLQWVLPAIQVHKQKELFLPWGCCATHASARFPHKLEDNILNRLQKTVSQRYQSILRWIQYRYTTDINSHSGDVRNPETEKRYSLNVEYKDMMEVSTLALPAPKREPADIRYFAKPAKINELWGVLSFVRDHNQHLMKRLITTLTLRAQERSMSWDEKVVLEQVQVDQRDSADDRRRLVVRHIGNLIEQVQKYTRDRPAPKLKLILCIMERKMSPEYATLKYHLDLIEGVPSQIIILPGSEREISRRVNNLLMKINVKCGGQNFGLSRETKQQMPLLLQKTILMGADVTHPGDGDRGPSIAAVVATTDSTGLNYATRLRAQDGRVERLVQLQEMVEDLISVYRDNQGFYPENILFFRDGISDQFLVTSLRYEGTAILRAAQALDRTGSYRPKVAIVLAIKRHHTRFFVFSNKRTEMENPTNLPKGCVVANGVTHPIEYDFFLASHDCRIGTSRPTHYHVLLDQIDIQPDELYTIVYNLCWTFQRCHSSVSLVTPVYYAHLAAFRAKVYVEFLSATTRDYRRINAHRDLRNRLWYL